MLKKCLFVVSLFLIVGLSSAQNAGSKPLTQTYQRKVNTQELQNNNEVYCFNGKPYTGISIDLFENKTKQQEINWKDGLLHGLKTEYFPGGRVIRSTMNFYEGKRNGYFVYYHENTKVKLEGKYLFDQLDSTIKCYYETGNLKYVHNYNNGVRVGESLSYFKNGNLEQKTNLKNEKPHGLMQTFYEAGNIRQVANYNEGVSEGQFIRYHLTGLMAEESYYKNGYLDSVSRYWDNVFGTMLKEEYYKLGKKDGTWITFNEGGDTLTVYNYKNDLLNGHFKKYYSGVVEQGDKMNGKNEKFDRSKSSKVYVRVLDEYGTYVDGKLDGEFKTGLYNREARAEGTYSMGIMVGEWQYFNEDDKLVLLEKYNEAGELIYQKPKLQRSKTD